VRLRWLRLRLCRRRPLMDLLGRAKRAGGAGPTPGLHAYPRESSEGRARLHLRLDPDMRGLLLINADRAVHLNPTAAVMTWLVLEGKTEAEAVALLRSRYRVSARTAKQDLARTRSQVEDLIRPDGPCPIHDLDLELLPPFSQDLLAPYRMDLALTYRCNNECPHCYNARPRSMPEISTEDWKRILDRLWEAGVPHICFTGGEPTLRQDLPDLIAYAEKKGQITGLLTNGRRLSDRRFLDSLVAAGLDHVQITLESHDPAIHDRMVARSGAWGQTVEGIRNSLAGGLFVMTNTTLLAENSPHVGATIDFLAEMGVPTVGVNALIHAGAGATVSTGLPEAGLSPLLEAVRERTRQTGQRLIWYTPTQYCNFDPVQMQLGVKGCTAARYNMCVEPDGGAIPCQSYYYQVGNLLHDPWDSIWNHELSLWLRQRRYAPAKCEGCGLLAECGGGCPLSLAELAFAPAERPAEQ
jgi:radical SAM protein with 4Fe4S-binding SPASM domain